MDDFLKWLLGRSKADLAVALLGLPFGAAVDVWFYPGGTLDPFNTGLYFCAGSVGVKYAFESIRTWFRRRQRKAERTRQSAPQAVTTRGVDYWSKPDIENRCLVLAAALDSDDGRYPADREICQQQKAKLENRYRQWKDGAVSDADFSADLRGVAEKYVEVKRTRRQFQEGRGEKRIDGGSLLQP